VQCSSWGIGRGSCRNQRGSTDIGRPLLLPLPPCPGPLLLLHLSHDNDGVVSSIAPLSCPSAATRFDSTEQRGPAYATRLVSLQGRGLRQQGRLTRRGLLLYRQPSIVIFHRAGRLFRASSLPPAAVDPFFSCRQHNHGPPTRAPCGEWQ
jgi:hypothetical protein